MNDWTFTLAYGLLFAVCLYVSREGPSKDALAPGVIFPVLLFAYSLSSSLFVNEIGYTNFGYPVDAEILHTFYVCALVGLLGFFGGRYLSLQFPVWRLKARDAPVGGEALFADKLIVYALLYAVLSAPFIYTSFNALSQQSYLERALQLRVESMEDAASGLKNVFLVSAPVTLIVCAATLLFFDRRRGIAVRFAAASVIGLNLTANVLAGWRGSVMATLCVVGIYYHYRVKRFRVSHLLVGSALVYILVNAMALVRFTSDPKEMMSAMGVGLSENGLAFLSLSRSGELLTATNLMRQIGGVRDGELRFSFGSTIVDDVLVFVPRPLYPARPLPSAEKFVEIFYPGVRAMGGGYGFFILQEGHWAAGYLGVFALMCGFGYVVYSVYWVFLSKSASAFAVFAYALGFPALCVFSIRVGVISSFKSALISLVPLAILTLLPRVRDVKCTACQPPALS